jgi:Rrf2 family protein
MLRMSRKTLYALEAVVDIAINARPEPVQSKDITARQGIPQRYLESVMQQLVRAGVLRGVRGPRGGYRLARERRRITVGEVIRLVAAVDGDDDEMEGAGSPLGQEVVYPVLEEAQQEMLRKLDDITVEDLCRQAEQSGIPPASAAGGDFSI